MSFGSNCLLFQSTLTLYALFYYLTKVSTLDFQRPVSYRPQCHTLLNFQRNLLFDPIDLIGIILVLIGTCCHAVFPGNRYLPGHFIILILVQHGQNHIIGSYVALLFIKFHRHLRILGSFSSIECHLC